MTILAGVFARRPEYRITDAICQGISTALSRDPGDRVDTFRDERFLLAKVDIQAFARPAFRVTASGSASALVGEPLLELGDNDPGRTRTEDLELLHAEWDADQWDLLRSARGVFAGITYDACNARLNLLTDKLGVRPLYWWATEEYLVFATALRIIEAIEQVPKRLDFRAVTEIAHFGYPLAGRTPYVGVSALRPAEIVTITEDQIASRRYWHWDEIATSTLPEPELVRRGYEAFRSGIQRRLRRDTATAALLSGGLDSRSIVGMLRDLDVAVHTYNLAPAGTQDRQFGRDFAHRMGTLHEEIDLDSDWNDVAAVNIQLAGAWKAFADVTEAPPERPGLLWGGNGGSVGLGLVHLTPEVVEHMRSGQRELAIEHFLEHSHVVRKLMSSTTYGLAVDILRQGVREELDVIHCDDPARAYFLLFMFNDQRRQLTPFFESVDLHRLELHLPFFDSDFLQVIMSTPMDLLLGHKYYMKWLAHFPSAVTTVPWQAYPGHEPCPVEFDSRLRPQWAGGFTAKARKRRLVLQALRMLRSGSFPRPLIRRWFVGLATAAYWLGLGDYSYVIRIAHPYWQYWSASRGDYALPDSAPTGR